MKADGKSLKTKECIFRYGGEFLTKTILNKLGKVSDVELLSWYWQIRFMIKIIIEATGPERARAVDIWCSCGRIDVHIAEIVIKDINGIVGRRTDGRIVNSIIEATGFQFGKYFCEETWFSIYAQHTWTQAIQ